MQSQGLLSEVKLNAFIKYDGRSDKGSSNRRVWHSQKGTGSFKRMQMLDLDWLGYHGEVLADQRTIRSRKFNCVSIVLSQLPSSNDFQLLLYRARTLFESCSCHVYLHSSVLMIYSGCTSFRFLGN